MFDSKRSDRRQNRQRRVRRRIRGTVERPRLCVFRSARHIYAQVICDDTGVTLATASTRSPELRGQLGGNIAAARKVGELVARVCRDKSIEKVVFDRNGFLYHGRVRALAEAARENGLQL